MNRNFLRVASVNIKTKLLNVNHNKNEMLKYMDYASKNHMDIVLFPELSLTGVSAGEMITSDEIISRCKVALKDILARTKDSNTIFVFGLPIKADNKAKSVMLYIQNGKILENTTRDTYEFLEQKYFSNHTSSPTQIFENLVINFNFSDTSGLNLDGKNIKLIFENELYNSNLYISKDTSILLIAGNKQTDIENLDYTLDILKAISKQNNIAIIYAGASNFESSSNGVYASNKYIIENGQVLEESTRFRDGMIYSEINLDEIRNDNKYYNYYNYQNIILKNEDYKLKRKLSTTPYFHHIEYKDKKFINILDIQSEALARRLMQIPDKKIFLGLSGGLDSTLALIVASFAYSKLELDSKDIYAISMPGLGTSNRTKVNGEKLAQAYNVTYKSIDITDSVLQHFKDIEHSETQYDITFENAQARERTQILMDLSNKHGGIVLGTGNMSEIALGWSTYNADHMSMYSVNSGLPKTLLKEVVRYVANSSNNELLKTTLIDILDTPISPELLPTDENDNIVQHTEDNVGPYELHDFFIYHLVKNKSKISNIKYMAKVAFDGKYTDEEIDKWMSKLLWRFSTQQFKRNVSPDFPQILEYSLKNIDFITPSDIDPNSFN